MFGVRKKVYEILALCFSIIGIVILALTIFNVFGEEKETNMIFTLSSVICLLLAFALYLRPKSKIMNNVQKIESNYRTEVYTLIMKDSTTQNKIDVKRVTVKETEDHHVKLVQQKGNDEIILNDLSFDEGLYIIIRLIEEFGSVMYAVIDETKKLSKYKKPSVATIDSFEMEFIYLNGEVKVKKFIENHKYL